MAVAADRRCLIIAGRQAVLRGAIQQREAELGALDGLALTSIEALRAAALVIDRLREVFAGPRDADELADLPALNGRILADAKAHAPGEVSEVRRAARRAGRTPVGGSAGLAHRRGDRTAADLGPLAGLYRPDRGADRGRPPPVWLAADDRAAAARLLAACEARLAALDEAARTALVAAWQVPCRALTDVSTLDRASAEGLLRGLSEPPCALSPTEQTWQRETQARLTAQLDQLGIEDLIARIERLSPPLQQRLLQRLAALVGG